MPTANTREDLRQLRVDQVGGLCAPSHLRQVFAQYKTGKASQQELDRAKDEAIRHVIANDVNGPDTPRRSPTLSAC